MLGFTSLGVLSGYADDCAPGYHIEHRPSGDVCVPDSPPPVKVTPTTPPTKTPAAPAKAKSWVDYCQDIVDCLRIIKNINDAVNP